MLFEIYFDVKSVLNDIFICDGFIYYWWARTIESLLEMLNIAAPGSSTKRRDISSSYDIRIENNLE